VAVQGARTAPGRGWTLAPCRRRARRRPEEAQSGACAPPQGRPTRPPPISRGPSRPTHTEPSALNTLDALQDDAGRVCVDNHCASRHTHVTVRAHESAPPRRASPSHLTFVRTAVRTVVLLWVVGVVGRIVGRQCCMWPRACCSTATSASSSASVCPTTTRAAAANSPILLRRICFRRTAGLQGVRVRRPS